MIAAQRARAKRAAFARACERARDSPPPNERSGKKTAFRTRLTTGGRGATGRRGRCLPWTPIGPSKRSTPRPPRFPRACLSSCCAQLFGKRADEKQGDGGNGARAGFARAYRTTLRKKISGGKGGRPSLIGSSTPPCRERECICVRQGVCRRAVSPCLLSGCTSASPRYISQVPLA